MDTDTLRADSEHVLSVKPSANPSAPLSVVPPQPVAKSPSDRTEPSSSGRTTPQSDNSTDGDDVITPLHCKPPTMPPSAMKPPAKPKHAKPPKTPTSPKRSKGVSKPTKSHKHKPHRPAKPTPPPVRPVRRSPLTPPAPTPAAHNAPTPPRRRPTYRMPRSLLPTWLPASAYRLSAEDEDDALGHRLMHLREKTDEEMEAFANAPACKPRPDRPPAFIQLNALCPVPPPPPPMKARLHAISPAARRAVATAERTASRERAAVTRKRSRAAAQLDARPCTPTGKPAGRAVSTRGGGASASARLEDRSVNERGSHTGRAQSNGAHTGVKKARHGNSGAASGGKGHAARALFEKHEGKKGWLVCKACRAAVWPPNCSKHLANCTA